MSLLEDIVRARRISTPIIAITSADQEATIKTILPLLEPGTPAIQYDIAQGPVGLNKEGEVAVAYMTDNDPDLVLLLAEEPARAMVKALEMLGESVLFFLNAQRHLEDARVTQAIGLMRDRFKSNGRTIILLGPQITLPAQIAGDVMLLDDPLPGPEEIQEILGKIHGYAKVDLPDEDTSRKAVEAVRGLHAAACDQAFAFAMEPTGISIPICWSQKRSRVEQTRGLTFYRGGETYNNIGGLLSFKNFMKEIYEGPEPFKLIVWLDEIEKTFTGSVGYHGDGGVGADQLGVILSNMEDNGWGGAIAVGPPGAGKSIIAKATGNNFGVPCIRMDLGAMKGGIVGESEQHIRQAMKVLYGIAEEGAFFIATCNSVNSLPPELKRRFSLGRTWFFDLPDTDEKESIWGINLTRYNIATGTVLPDDTDWTGSDIRDCCMAAYRRRRTLIEVATQIVPVAKQDPDRITALRDLADNRFLSASYDGAYRKPSAEAARKPTASPQIGDRKMRFN